MFQKYNPNPTKRNVGDCAIRAIAKALDISWEQAYAKLCANGYMMGDLPNANSTWGALLRQNGFVRENLPTNCPDCYTVDEFARDHADGIYVLGTGDHVVTVVDGDYYDTWDSGSMIPQYFWVYKGE